MIKSEKNVDIRRLLQTAINCSVVKPRKIEQRFDLPEQSLSSISDELVSNEILTKQILGFILSCSTAKYGISKKKKTPKGCPNLEIWNDLTSGSGSYDGYEAIFTYLSHSPVQEKKVKSKKKKGRIIDKSPQTQKEIAEREKRQLERIRYLERQSWLLSTREIRAQIRWSLTDGKMRSIYINKRKERKMTIEGLSIKSNTSRYAVEAVEKGTAFGTYLVARLLLFILSNQDIDETEYKNSPIEVFVDYLAGWKFRSYNYTPHKAKAIGNPKACNLPIYLKK